MDKATLIHDISKANQGLGRIRGYVESSAKEPTFTEDKTNA